MTLTEAETLVAKTRRAAGAAKETFVFVQLAEGPDAAIDSARRQYLDCVAQYKLALSNAVSIAQKLYDIEIETGYQDSIEQARRIYARFLAARDAVSDSFGTGTRCED